MASLGSYITFKDDLKMKPNVSSAASLILLLMAASSLLSMIGLTQIDGIVHRDLYRFGLQFSYEWAMPYWTMTAIVFAMGWFNIIVAIAFQLYVLLSRRRETEVPMIQSEITEIETPSTHMEEAEKPEEARTRSEPVEEETAPRELSETKAPEEQKESGEKPQEDVEPIPEETSMPTAETQSETQKENGQTPILVGVPEVEI